MANSLRLPPHSLEAEKSVLGSMFLSEKAAASAMSQLNAQDFYLPRHRDIFTAMSDIAGRGPIDHILVLDRLKKLGYSEDDEMEYLSDLTVSVPDVANLDHYVNIITEKAMLRRLVEAAHSIEKEAMEDADETSAIVARANEAVYQIAVHEERDTLKPIRPALVESYRQIGKALASGTGIMGIPTGFPTLDRLLSGLQGSQMIVLAGRPGMGKTSLALDIVRNVAIKEQLPCAVFSLEMSAPQLATRMMSAVAEIDLQALRNKTPETERALEKLLPAMDKISRSPIYIDDTVGITVPEMVAKARKLKMEHGLALVMIDYLQLMSTTGRSDNRQTEVSEMTRSIKIASRELDVPILLLSQLSRASERRGGDKLPMLSDLRESGSIEQDADVVIFIHRDKYYEGAADNTTRIIVAKQRMGPTDTVLASWVANQTRFYEVAVSRSEN